MRPEYSFESRVGARGGWTRPRWLLQLKTTRTSCPSPSSPASLGAGRPPCSTTSWWLRRPPSHHLAHASASLHRPGSLRLAPATRTSTAAPPPPPRAPASLHSPPSLSASDRHPREEDRRHRERVWRCRHRRRAAAKELKGGAGGWSGRCARGRGASVCAAPVGPSRRGDHRDDERMHLLHGPAGPHHGAPQ